MADGSFDKKWRFHQGSLGKWKKRFHVQMWRGYVKRERRSRRWGIQSTQKARWYDKSKIVKSHTIATLMSTMQQYLLFTIFYSSLRPRHPFIQYLIINSYCGKVDEIIDLIHKFAIEYWCLPTVNFVENEWSCNNSYVPCPAVSRFTVDGN